MAGAASSLEVVEIMVISWNYMIHVGCPHGATSISELTCISIPCQDGPPQSGPVRRELSS